MTHWLKRIDHYRPKCTISFDVRSRWIKRRQSQVSKSRGVQASKRARIRGSDLLLRIMDNLPSPNIQDGPMVGTPLILQSKYVAEAPERVNRPVPVPSFYSDDRGEIHNVCVGQTKSTGSQRKGQRINLLYTKAGVMRSGDLHPNTQHDFVFSGSVKVWTLQKDGHTHVHVYNKNDVIAIPPFTPHLFEFEQDSVLAEWWDGDFKAWFYEPYRSIVDASFVSTMPGHLTTYVVQNKADSGHRAFRVHGLLHDRSFWMGILVGLGIGLAVHLQ